VSLDAILEQTEARRLLGAALAEGPAHAYLFHGPPGVGKETAAKAFAAELLGSPTRVAHETHPDLYVLRQFGQMIRLDEIHTLHHDLHLRPFEADRRVYLILGAHLLNREAADALLKDLEEPPDYAIFVLVADQVAAISPTIRSRCQPIAFRRLSTKAVREEAARIAPELTATQQAALARVAAGRLDRLRWLVESQAGGRRDRLLAVARSVYGEAEFDPTAAALAVLASAKERATIEGDRAAAKAEELSLTEQQTEKQVEKMVSQAKFGAEREDVLGSLEELATWFRDLLAIGVGAEAAVINADQLDRLREDALPERTTPAGEAAEAVHDTWRELERLNIANQLALEALFVRLRRLLGPRA
jgi:DNA polymerase-3 subunit delta'